MPTSLADLFQALREQANRFPGSIALASHAGHVTFDRFLSNIECAARAAAKAGIRPGQLVVVGTGNPDVSLTVALSLIRLGCRVGYSRNLALYEAASERVDAIIGDRMTPEMGGPVLVVTPEWFRQSGHVGKDEAPIASDCSLITSSSGSTGRPKLIEIPASTIVEFLRRRRQAKSVDHENDISGFRALSLQGSRVQATFFDSLSVLLKGGMVISVLKRDPDAVLDAIDVFQPDLVSIAPSLLISLLKALDLRPRRLRKIAVMRSSGAYFAPRLQRDTLDRLAERVFSVYGATETGWIAWGSLASIEMVPRSVGRIFDGLEVAAFEDGERRLPAGHSGEIRIKRPAGVSSVYLGAPHEERDPFQNDWFSTGDLGLIDENRNLIICGRLTNVINMGGSKVNPEDIEARLQRLASIADVGVTGVDMVDDGFQRVCAAIVSSSPPSLKEVNMHLDRQKFGWPVHEIKLVRAIPRTESGKIDRVALKHLCAT